MALKISWKKALVHFLYGQIRGFVENLIGNFGLAIDTDLAIAALSYFVLPRWSPEIAEALFYASVQSIGMSGGLSLGALFGGRTKAEKPAEIQVAGVVTPQRRIRKVLA